MASSGKTPFEIIRGEGKQPDRFRVPHWWRSAKRNAEEEADPPGKAFRWLRQPLVLHLNRGILLGIIAILGATIVVAFEVGAARSRPAVAMTDQMASEAMADLRRGEINARLMRTESVEASRSTAGTAGATVGTPSTSTGQGSRDARPVGLDPIVSGSADDPREPGLNYYCLVTVPPANLADAQRAVEFLRNNRVDAAIISVNNRHLQIIALRGFERPTSPQARDYERLLRALGKAWRAEHRGWSDWHDLYAIKHQP